MQTRFATTGLSLLRRSLGEDLTAAAKDGEEALTAPLPVEGAAFEELRHVVFLGDKWSAALCQEAALKIREAAGFWTEAYPLFEYQHGPISCAGPQSLVWAFCDVPDWVAADIEATGARLEVGRLDPQAELVRVHRLAVELALREGRDPDSAPAPEPVGHPQRGMRMPVVQVFVPATDDVADRLDRDLSRGGRRPRPEPAGRDRHARRGGGDASARATMATVWPVVVVHSSAASRGRRTPRRRRPEASSRAPGPRAGTRGCPGRSRRDAPRRRRAVRRHRGRPSTATIEFGQAERIVPATEVVMGSSSAITACGLARLGVPTALVSVVGDDLLGGFLLGELRDRGVDTTYVRVDGSLPTGTSTILTRPDGDRAILTALGSIGQVTVADAPSSGRRRARARRQLLPAVRPARLARRVVRRRCARRE